MKKMIIGIDPGTIRTGVAVINWEKDRVVLKDLQVITGGKASSPLSQRLYTIGHGLEQVYRRYQPQETAIEKVFLGKNTDSAFKLGHIFGICAYMAACYHSQVFSYASRLIKQSVTGSGAADKVAVRNFVLNAVQQPDDLACEEDATDALAVALCHTIHRETTRLLNPVSPRRSLTGGKL